MDKMKSYGASGRFLNEATLYPDKILARIIAQYSDLYKVVTEQSEGLAEVSGKFRFEAKRLSDFPAVGDFVMIDRDDTAKGNAIIHAVLTRKSCFERAAVGNVNQTQVVAANVDILFICMSLNENYNLSRLERYLSVAWDSGATPVVILTKSDLQDKTEDIVREIETAAIGVDILVTSAFDRDVRGRLKDFVKDGVTASFIGSSGVGKSTLVNLLLGEEIIETQEIREDGKGRHTTTRRELFLLPDGGVVIDTPGMREFGAQSVNLSKSFVDIDELIGMCKFADCTHKNEPGCAVLRAIEAGELDNRRFENYLKLKKEASYDGLSHREIEKEKINSMFGGMSEMKKMMDYAKKKKSRR